MQCTEEHSKPHRKWAAGSPALGVCRKEVHHGAPPVQALEALMHWAGHNVLARSERLCFAVVLAEHEALWQRNASIL